MSTRTFEVAPDDSAMNAVDSAIRAAVHAANDLLHAGDGSRNASAAVGNAAAAFGSAATVSASGVSGMAAVKAVTKECSLDAIELESGRSPFQRPLLQVGEVAELLPMVHRDWRGQGPGWDFWTDWYEGYLTGQPLDLDLLEKVALIPDEDWETGDDHVNRVIASIYDAHRVAEAAARLEADLVLTVSEVPGIGHNRPPEDISDLPLVVPPIQEPLRAIRNQALAPRPDKQAVNDAIATLRTILSEVGSYIAGKLDLAIDESIKALAPWVVKGVVAWYGANKLGLVAFIEQATRWLAGL